MPLQTGSSQATISRNVAELVRAGHSQAQAAAIAYKQAGKDSAGVTLTARELDLLRGLSDGLARSEAEGSTSAAISSHAQDKAVQDVNGFKEYPDTRLSKVGVFPYRGRQLPGAPDPDAIYQVLRPEEELSAPECIESFKLLPWIDEHTMLGSEELGLTPAEEKGVQGTTGEAVYFKGGALFGNLKVYSETLAELIESGKRELSCGYRCEYDWSPGVFNGQTYDLVQRNIRGNHIALVNSGRMGSDVAVFDGIATDSIDFPTSTGADMADETKGGGEPGALTLEQALEAVTKLMPAIQRIMSASNPDAAGANPPTDNPAPDADKPAIEDSAAAPTSVPGAPPAATGEDPKKGEGMDAAALTKTLMAGIAKRDQLARDLSAHVGTFDHSLMTEADVAAYGCKKLGLQADAGAHAATLRGYLAGAAKAKPVAKQVTAADSAPADNFVTRFLKGA